MEGLYILDENNIPVELLIESTEDLKKWVDFMSSPKSIIKQEQLKVAYVSTLFLGFDRYPQRNKTKNLFEMTVFVKDRKFGKFCDNYAEAAKEHEIAVAFLNLIDALGEEDVYDKVLSKFK